MFHVRRFLDLDRRFVKKIPDEPVRASMSCYLHLILVICLTGVAAYQVAFRIQDRQLHRICWRLTQPVVDDRAIRRVCSGIEHRLDLAIIVAFLRRIGRRDRPGIDVGDEIRIFRRTAIAMVNPPAVGWPRLVEVDGFACQVVLHLVQRRDIIEHPEGPAMGGNQQIRPLDHEVMNRCHRQVALEWLPVLSIVERDVQSGLAACVEQTFPVRILPDHPGEIVCRYAISDELPGLPVVRSL